MPDFLIKEAIRIFHENNYEKIIASGGDLPAGRFIADERSMAGITRATLLELGFDSLKIVTLHGGKVLRNRTYMSALMLKRWLAQNSPADSKKVDVITLGCHAGRSRLLFQKALGNDYKVGVWSVPDKSYDINRWWKTSKGSRTVISEIIAYFYARLFFQGRKNERKISRLNFTPLKSLVTPSTDGQEPFPVLPDLFLLCKIGISS